MLRIVKSGTCRFDHESPVSLNTKLPGEYAPSDDEKPITAPSEDEINEISAEELQRRTALEEKERFETAVNERVAAIVAGKEAHAAAERNRLLSVAKVQADELIEQAKAKTKAVLEAAEKEGERLKEQSRQDGYKSGFEEGKAESLAQCEKYLDAAARFLSEINSRKEAYYITHEYEMTQTVMAMVEKITMSEIKTDPLVIDNIVANAARNFRNSDYLKISLCSGEASRQLICDKEYVKSIIPFIPELEVEELSPEDAPEGTIVLDNGSEILDASIPTQLDFLREILRQHSESAPET